MNIYHVRRSGEIAGVWHEAGSVVRMTTEQAKHLTAPYGSELELVRENDRAKPAKAIARRKARS